MTSLDHKTARTARTGEPDPPLTFQCNHCMTFVDEATHRRHLHILDSLESGNVDGFEDLFVHCRGAVNEFDENGLVVVCDQCFIVELSDNLQ